MRIKIGFILVRRIADILIMMELVVISATEHEIYISPHKRIEIHFHQEIPIFSLTDLNELALAKIDVGMNEMEKCQSIHILYSYIVLQIERETFNQQAFLLGDKIQFTIFLAANRN